MASLTIQITRSVVYDEVERAASYMGDKSSLYEQISASKRNEDLLSRLYEEACSYLGESLKQHVSSTTLDTTGYTVTLSLPSNYDNGCDNIIKENAKAFVIGKCLSSWFEIADKPDASGFSAKSEEALSKCISAIYKRKRPTRGSSSSSSSTINASSLATTGVANLGGGLPSSFFQTTINTNN